MHLPARSFGNQPARLPALPVLIRDRLHMSEVSGNAVGPNVARLNNLLQNSTYLFETFKVW